MFSVSARNEALFQMEEEHRRIVRLLRNNRQLLEGAELAIEVAKYNYRRNTNSQNKGQLLEVLEENCRQWLQHWTDRKDLLFLFCHIDDALRQCRNSTETSS